MHHRAERARVVRPPRVGLIADGWAPPRPREEGQAEHYADQPEPEPGRSRPPDRGRPSGSTNRRCPSLPRRLRTGRRARLSRRCDARPTASSRRDCSSSGRVTRVRSPSNPVERGSGCADRAAFHPCPAGLSKPFALTGRRRESVPRSRRLTFDRPRGPARASESSADWMVLTSSIVTVIGPTPPGTGVMREAFSRTASKSTSPTRRPSASRLMPTSGANRAHQADQSPEDRPGGAQPGGPHQGQAA